MTIANEIARLSRAQLERFTAQELAALIRGLGVVVQELQGRKYETRNFAVLDAVTIRDTNNHDSPVLIDLYQAENYGWLINNLTDQVLTFRIVGALNNAANAKAPLGDPFPVAANSMDCFSVPKDLWLPFIGARVSFGTAPTTGKVTVVLCRRELKWER
ncbi:MAG: hypothetical protein IIA92_13750 [Chloroflexi bacterium]|nr:hypothetical protein [Chloroflexota bacterium]